MGVDSLERLGFELGLDLRAEPVESIAASMTQRGARMRGRLAALLTRALDDRSAIADEDTRALVAKTAVALLPSSLYLLRKAIGEEPKGDVAELHFSIFVFLGDAHRWLKGDDRAEVIHGLVEEYLTSVCTSEGQSAWMAGDMLGDHWPLEESLPVLFRVIREAKCEAGREGALHGLAHALERSPKAMQWSIMEQLQVTAASDRSEAIRAYASSIIGPLRGL